MIGRIKGYPVSPHQHTLWRQSHGGAVQVIIELAGDIETERLLQDLHRTMTAHDILRTQIVGSHGDSNPLQVVGKDLQASVELDASNSARRLTMRALVECADVPSLIMIAESAMSPADGPPNRVQYRDFSAWHRGLLAEADQDSGREFWRACRNQHLDIGGQPADRRSVTLSFDFEPPDEAIFLASWQLALDRSSDAPPLTGIVIDPRDDPELAGAIGPYARLVPAHYDGRSPRDVPGAVAAAKAAADTARVHQAGFVLDEWGNSPEAWFRAGFGLTDRSWRSSGSIRWRVVDDSGPGERCGLFLSVETRERGGRAVLHFDAHRSSEAAAERLLERFISVLTALPKAGSRDLSSLPLLGPEERASLLRVARGRVSTSPGHRTLTSLWDGAAHRHLETTAVIDGDRAATYRQLDCRANGVAELLLIRGLHKSDRVAVDLPRGMDFVIAILGILKVGATYVPLERSLPLARRTHMLGDSGARWCVSDGAPSVSGVGLILLDEAESRDEAPSVEIDPRQSAYLLYTSGSTGRPKGVLTSHAALTNYIEWAVDAYEPRGSSPVPVHSDLGFDLTVTSLLVPLLCGQCVCFPPGGTGLAPLIDMIESTTDIGLVKITPSHLEGVNAAVAGRDLRDRVASLVVGGETLPGRQVRLWREFAPRTRIFNEYGPTEATVGCCVHEMVGACPDDAAPIPIGRPIANTALYLLDAELQLVPWGFTGEIYIGGLCLAECYLGQPGATASRFLPDPFAAEPGARMYRSGDLARLRDDGNLVFVGRNDQQVKILGHRIELGEVETTLRAHPAIADAACVASGGALVAFVVMADSVALGRLYRYLRQELPEYMIPARVEILERLPLNAHGKLDRTALLNLTPSTDSGAPYEAPRTPTERALVEVIQTVLGHDRVGIQDNFFEIGGHSLLATQAVARMRTALGIRVPLHLLFDYPSVSALAAQIHALEAEDGEL